MAAQQLASETGSPVARRSAVGYPGTSFAMPAMEHALGPQPLPGGARALPQDRQCLHRSRDRAPLRALGEGRPSQPRGVEEGRRGGPAAHRCTRRIRRQRRRLSLQRRHDRGDGQARLHRARLPPAFRYRRALHLQLRQRGAEAHLAAAHGQGRGHHRDCHDRARNGERPAGDPHHGAAPGQRAGGQRAEDLPHQWRPCRPRHSATSRRSARMRRTPPSCSSRTCACRPPTSSARRDAALPV
jgi:hypothetical protein